MPIPAISIRFGSGLGLLNYKIVLITNLIVGRGGVDSPRGVSKHVENKWGGVEPTPFVSKHVENERGWAWTHPVRVETRREQVGWGWINPIHVETRGKWAGWGWTHSVRVENGWGGVETTPVTLKVVKKE